MEKRSSWKDALWLAVCFAAVVLAALWTAQQTGAKLLEHSAFDSYAKQAMAWRDGRIALDKDYPWLELAIFEGNYYVSFPPVPAIPMWVLSFFMGEQTPSGLMTLLYFLAGVACLLLLFRRYLPARHAGLLAVFAALGGSVLDLAVSAEGFSGGVWYQAQLLGFFFTALAFLLLDGKSRAGWAVGLVGIALAVGCRPFNAVYVPVLLWMLYGKVAGQAPLRKIVAMLPYVIVPALIACAYGAYNYVRFGNPLEFGHSYLPELAQAGEGMFVPSRIWDNLRNIVRLPTLSDGALVLPVISGFAVYITNPMLIVGTERALTRGIAARRVEATDALLWASALIHAALLLMHRTNGGWQYGTRYLCDLLPALAYLAVRGGQPLRRWETFAMGALVAMNVYGTIAFHFM